MALMNLCLSSPFFFYGLLLFLCCVCLLGSTFYCQEESPSGEMGVLFRSGGTN
jgi:hypothetical protein